MNILENFDKKTCCGCGACSNICPTKAISMVEDFKGFKYPIIDTKKCIDCGLCIETCDFRKKSNETISSNAHAVRHKDINEVSTSRSGAFFILLAKFVIKNNGIVFGVEMIDKKNIIHKSETHNNLLYKFKGSKYVQSDMKNVMCECKEHLLKGKLVLFSGTPCQVHGLISFLKISKINTDQLITCDFFCHGVPSQKIWNEYIEKYENKKHLCIDKVNFRDKNKGGWRGNIESYKLNDNSKVYSRNWTRMYYSGVLYMDACYNCKYINIQRKSDFTIGDFWGIENNFERLDDDKGVSLVLVNNQYSQKIFNGLADQMIFKKTDLLNSIQRQLQYPVKKGNDFDVFWDKYKKNSNKCISQYFLPSKKQLFLKKVKRIFK